MNKSSVALSSRCKEKLSWVIEHSCASCHCTIALRKTFSRAFHLRWDITFSRQWPAKPGSSEAVNDPPKYDCCIALYVVNLQIQYINAAWVIFSPPDNFQLGSSGRPRTYSPANVGIIMKYLKAIPKFMSCLTHFHNAQLKLELEICQNSCFCRLMPLKNTSILGQWHSNVVYL